MTRQTLRDWVRRYNEHGIEGLKDRPKGHVGRALTPAQEKELEELVFQGPEGALVRWRCVDLKAEIQKRFGVVYHERSVSNILKRLGFSRISVRPMHPEADPDVQEAFKKPLPHTWQKSCPTTPRAKSSNFGSKTKRGSDKKAH